MFLLSISCVSSWASLGACSSLEHLDLSGCEKITDHTLKRLSLGLGDLTSPSFPIKSPERKAKLLAGPPSPIKLQSEDPACPIVRGRQALIFKRRPGGRGNGCGPAHVWVLDPAELVDIEDTAEWNRRSTGTSGSPTLENSSGPLEVQTLRDQCCCRQSRKRGYRTGKGGSNGSGAVPYWQQLQHVPYRDAQCGHSTCCGGDTALRTSKRAQCSSQATEGSTEFRTKCPTEGQTCSRHDKQTGKYDTFRSLRFLSLSGCYQITDLGLR